MKAITLTFLALMLTTVLSYSQTTYPAMTLSKTGDTTCTVSISTIRTYNHAMEDLDACSIMADTLYAQKERYKSLNKDLENEITLCGELVTNLKSQVAEKTITEQSYKKGEKRSKIKSKFLKGFATGFGIVAIVEAGVIWLQSFH